MRRKEEEGWASIWHARIHLKTRAERRGTMLPLSLQRPLVSSRLALKKEEEDGEEDGAERRMMTMIVKMRMVMREQLTC